jgi:hypothetical protein
MTALSNCGCPPKVEGRPWWHCPKCGEPAAYPMRERVQPCSCGATDVRPYLYGWRCPEHTPAKLAGHVEPHEPSGRPWWIRPDGTVIPPLPDGAS